MPPRTRHLALGAVSALLLSGAGAGPALANGPTSSGPATHTLQSGARPNVVGPSATAPAPSPEIRKLTLTPSAVRGVIDRGLRVQVTTERVGFMETRLFVYARTLSRGGLPVQGLGPGDKVFISRLLHLHFSKPGTQYVTLHVGRDEQPALLRAGTIILGIGTYSY